MKNKKRILFEIYDKDILLNNIVRDEEQIKILLHFQKLYNFLCQKFNFFSYIFFVFFKNDLKHGIYLWSDVGRGKTYLINLFFDALPFHNKIRLHFHSFMYKIHNELSVISGIYDPLNVIAKKLSINYKIIFLDEFFVSDIADAMLLGRLLEKLFLYNVYILINSNIMPDNLYENGLQRQHFMKTIALIKTNLVILNISTEIDYRLKFLKNVSVYYKINEFNITNKLFEDFYKLSFSKKIYKNGIINILNRNINFLYLSDTIIWFTFDQLCSSPRSQNDYIELAKIYDFVFITDIPLFTDLIQDKILRFIFLVDEFYDKCIKIMLTSEIEIIDMIVSAELIFEFKRTLSRLIEMKSLEYLHKKRKY